MAAMTPGVAYCPVCKHLKMKTSKRTAADHTGIEEGLGFVQHPDLGPEIVGLAFVHQLHCLVNLSSPPLFSIPLTISKKLRFMHRTNSVKPSTPPPTIKPTILATYPTASNTSATQSCATPTPISNIENSTLPPTASRHREMTCICAAGSENSSTLRRNGASMMEKLLVRREGSRKMDWAGRFIMIMCRRGEISHPSIR